MKRKITFYILFILMLGSVGIKVFALPSESFGSPRAPLHYVSSFSNTVKNDYSSRWNSGDIREMGSVVGEGLITLLTAGVKYADNAGRLGKTGAFIQKLKNLKKLKSLRKVKTGQGGLNLFRSGKPSTAIVNGWKSGNRMLNLFNKGSPKASWKQNAGYLRQEMGKGQPIFDSYRNPYTGVQIPSTSKGRFLNAERQLLETRGWNYNPSTGAYHPLGG